MAPVTGRHSVIESPDSVSRVMPPTTIMTTIMAAQTKSQAATARSAGVGPGVVAAMVFTAPACSAGASSLQCQADAGQAKLGRADELGRGHLHRVQAPVEAMPPEIEKAA